MTDANFISDYFKSLAKKRWGKTSKKKRQEIMARVRAKRAMRNKA